MVLVYHSEKLIGQFRDCTSVLGSQLPPKIRAMVIGFMLGNGIDKENDWFWYRA